MMRGFQARGVSEMIWVWVVFWFSMTGKIVCYLWGPVSLAIKWVYTCTDVIEVSYWCNEITSYWCNEITYVMCSVQFTLAHRSPKQMVTAINMAKGGTASIVIKGMGSADILAFDHSPSLSYIFIGLPSMSIFPNSTPALPTPSYNTSLASLCSQFPWVWHLLILKQTDVWVTGGAISVLASGSLRQEKKDPKWIWWAQLIRPHVSIAQTQVWVLFLTLTNCTTLREHSKPQFS